MLSFRSMRQTDLQTRTTREVRRRPVFVSPKSIDGRLSRLKGINRLQSDATIYPSSWEPMPPGKEFIRFLLNRSSAEFRYVERVFRKSVQQENAKINAIERIQNPHIWDKYQRQKKYMVQKNGDIGLQVNLFHGTDEQSVTKICRQNFDFRVAGKNATLFGHGTYFARDASYSDRYSSDDDHGQRHMFLAYVLVGRYTVGQRSYKRPPEINTRTGELYDSCVNRQNDPTVFVIFDREQCYPAYLINFTKLNANTGPPSPAKGLKGTNHLQSDATIYPSSWEPMPPGKEFIRCLLDRSSAEFRYVERVFRQSVQQDKAKINAIERIQNPLIWDKYQRQKKYMIEKKGDTGLLVDMYLFHGTDEQSVPKICRQNFDFRVAGKNATLFGQGTYFARDASYSDRYSSDDDHGQRHMFLAYVLVGRYTVGQSSYKRPPEINQHTGELYDSCVNRQNDPTVFVIFDREQCYPAYLINFTKLNANTGPPSAAIRLKGTNHLQSDATIYQSSWEPMPPGKEFIRCLLNTSSAEFQFVERVFRQSVQQDKAKINAIERIQNPLIWDKYQRQKKYMVQKNGDIGLQVNLFHGTDEQSVTKICRQNFDFRVAGKNATLFGQGTYFARDASYSDCYSSDDDRGQRHMFLAYVLVGRYTVGQSSYKRPPEINTHTGELYDSCVNRQNDPTVFVIFDREQCCPAYLINFTKLNANRGLLSPAKG
ncbi:uncharacterized protein [Ptychodera flava]|uniref:uncharacterized protein n=1 Tax=Ptychodera flava TaxID=63121 RepID=UPI003969E8BB